MAKDTLYPINISTPVQVTREQYTNVGSGDNIVGDYMRAIYGGTDFEIWDSATGGTQLTDGIDYDLTNLDQKYTERASRNVYKNYEITNPVYQTGNIYITYKTIGTVITTDIINDINAQLAVGSNNRARITQQNGGVWGEWVYVSSTQVALKPKSQNGESWIGVILSDGSYLEDTTSSSIVRTLDATTLDGIGAKQNNSWYWNCIFENSSGALDWDFAFTPTTLISASNPTNDITLTQLNGQDIRSLYPIGAEVAIWESGSKYETPLYDTTGTTYTPTSTDMVIASYPAANQIRLSANLTVANFTAATAECYLVNGYEPIDCTTESIHTNIGSRGWKDTGVRIRTDGSGNIINFKISGERFIFTDGTGAANIDSPTANGYNNQSISGAAAVYRFNYVPPDKSGLSSVGSAGSFGFYSAMYYETYGDIIDGSGGSNGTIVPDSKILTQLVKLTAAISAVNMWIRGYELRW
jgi:hypothetical protein